MSVPVILAVDGNSLFHRAWHAYAARGADLRSPSGVPTGAVYGFLALLAGIGDKVSGRYGRLDAIVVGFDDHVNAVRKVEYPLYKAQRERKDDDLYIQMNALMELLPEFGVNVTVAPGLEADDVIGSVAHTATAAGWHTVIATSDRDSFSLISPTSTVMRLVSGLDNAVWFDEQTLIDKYSIRPTAYVRYAAVRGDVSDNLPGVPGIGEKRAAALWASFETYDEALASDTLAKVVGKAGATALHKPESREAFDRNISLMTIRTHIGIDLLGSLLRTDAATIAAAATAAGFSSLARRLSVALMPSRLNADGVEDFAVTASGAPAQTWADGTPVPDDDWFESAADNSWNDEDDSGYAPYVPAYIPPATSTPVVQQPPSPVSKLVASVVVPPTVRAPKASAVLDDQMALF